MMGLSDGGKSFPIGLAVLIQYRSVTDTEPASQPPSHVAVAITLNALAKASSLKMMTANNVFMKQTEPVGNIGPAGEKFPLVILRRST